MPAYDFRCNSCDHLFEVVRPSSRAAEAECCPLCASDTKRVFTPVGVVFKGSGFHNTDYRAKPTSTDTGSKEDAGSTPAPACGESGTCASCPASK